MTTYPIFSRTMLVVAPTCAVVPVAGLVLGAFVALIMIMVVAV